MVVVTLDEDGAVLLEAERPAQRVFGPPQRQARGAGAGDAFLAGMALALAAGALPRVGAEFGAITAATAVREDGTAVCSREALARIHRPETPKLTTREELTERLNELRGSGRRAVFTNGCFDIVHSGHTSFLAAARALGDCLIVALNTDASVASLKGPGRPINGFADRAEVLGALGCVDFVVAMPEDGPQALIDLLQPDVFVKGGDYTRETLPEAELVESYGGIVVILDYVAGHSTTGMIERIALSQGTGSAA